MHLTYIIALPGGYFSARGGRNGGARSITQATLFTQTEAADRARRLGGTVVRYINPQGT